MDHGTPNLAAAPEDDLLERSGPLKAELVAFGQSQRFAREFRAAYTERFADAEPRSHGDYVNYLDRFVLEHRSRDGRTIVEQFVASRPNLPEAERAMVLSWTAVVEGIFEVERHDGDAAIMINLIDESTYRVRSNKGATLLQQFTPQTVLRARILPLGSGWLLSGVTNSASPEGRSEMRRTAARIANTCPAAVFRNPDKLSAGWRLHHRMREHFIDFFGGDSAVVAGYELSDRMNAFLTHHAIRIRAARDSAPDPARPAVATDALDDDQPPTVPHMSMPSDLNQADTVGIVFDEVEGLLFLPEYRLVQEVFADPALIVERRYREAVSGYLKSQSIPPVVLRRLAEQDQDRASRVFARLLGKPRFTWHRDGEALLRRYKARFFDHTPLPGVTPLSARQRTLLQPTPPALLDPPA